MPSRKKSTFLVLSVLAIFLIIFIPLILKVERRGKVKPFKHTEIIMDTTVEITSIPFDEKAVEKAFNIVKEVDALMNNYKINSEISILNRQGENRVSPFTLKVIKKAINFSKLTEGAFDITCKPLLDLWRRAGREKRLPSPQAIKEAASLVSYKDIMLEGNLVKFKKRGMEIDLGGIAKGYAVDKAVEILKKEGIRRVLVNAGGDLYALGKGPDNKKWAIGIRNPRHKGRIVRIIRVENKAVATSGDYQRYFFINEKRHSHIVNPHTGMTVENTPMSVTIIASDATTADALATGVFVLGPYEGMDLINSLSDAEGMIISETGEGMEIVTSRGWAQFQDH
ncbi:MAG: FAD:protein FMN transferase [Candidatus Aerophobetes bacterium]|nr:FAD:protein FMN transferase [Candidatus Aerophobetes bacterium]